MKMTFSTLVILAGMIKMFFHILLTGIATYKLSTTYAPISQKLFDGPLNLNFIAFVIN